MYFKPSLLSSFAIEIKMLHRLTFFHLPFLNIFSFMSLKPSSSSIIRPGYLVIREFVLAFFFCISLKSSGSAIFCMSPVIIPKSFIPFFRITSSLSLSDFDCSESKRCSNASMLIPCAPPCVCAIITIAAARFALSPKFSHNAVRHSSTNSKFNDAPHTKPRHSCESQRNLVAKISIALCIYLSSPIAIEIIDVIRS